MWPSRLKIYYTPFCNLNSLLITFRQWAQLICFRHFSGRISIRMFRYSLMCLFLIAFSTARTEVRSLSFLSKSHSPSKCWNVSSPRTSPVAYLAVVRCWASSLCSRVVVISLLPYALIFSPFLASEDGRNGNKPSSALRSSSPEFLTGQ